jgi:hypothetical protein
MLQSDSMMPASPIEASQFSTANVCSSFDDISIVATTGHVKQQGLLACSVLCVLPNTYRCGTISH